MRAFVYLRQSLDRAGTNAAVDRQREDCLKLCAERGWEVARVWTDNDVSASSRLRWTPLVAWAGGFVAYQLIYPGTVPLWSHFWLGVDEAIGFTPPTWLGSSVAAIAVSMIIMVVLGRVTRRRASRPG